jgi:hypothetical protein
MWPTLLPHWLLSCNNEDDIWKLFQFTFRHWQPDNKGDNILFLFLFFFLPDFLSFPFSCFIHYILSCFFYFISDFLSFALFSSIDFSSFLIFFLFFFLQLCFISISWFSISLSFLSLALTSFFSFFFNIFSFSFYLCVFVTGIPLIWRDALCQLGTWNEVNFFSMIFPILNVSISSLCIDTTHSNHAEVKYTQPSI